MISTYPQARLEDLVYEKGDTCEGQIRPSKDGERYFALLKVNVINSQTPEKHKQTVLFDNLTPLYPEKKVNLEFKPTNYSTRMIDMFVPQGFGQRCLIVAPPWRVRQFFFKISPTR